MTANRTVLHLTFTLASSIGLALAGCADDGIDEDKNLLDLSRSLTVSPNDPVVALHDDLTVTVPSRFNVAYRGAAAAEFPDGLPLSIGSGLRFRRNGLGLSFYAVTDRGPSGDAPSFLDAAGVTHIGQAFAVPTFTPRIVTISVLPLLGPIVTSVLPIKSGGKPVTGLFPPALTTETGFAETLVPLPGSDVGLDAEGVDVDRHGNVWLCDEYGPSLVKVNAGSGEIMTKLDPGHGLPSVLASRQSNRGFEGVAVTPNGRVYGIVQSTLDVAGATKSKAQFIRLVEYDPSTRATRMFAYPHDIAQYAKSGDAKLGDLVAVDNHRFLVIEQGKDKNKALRNLVYALDIDGATDLTERTLIDGANVGKDLEYGTAAEIAAQVAVVRKTLVVDLRAQGWTDDKAEGLSLVDDKTLVLVNDQDFGVTKTMAGDPASEDPTAYVVDSTGALTIGGAPSSATFEFHAAAAAAQRSHLFVLRLRQPIAAYFPR